MLLPSSRYEFLGQGTKTPYANKTDRAWDVILGADWSSAFFFVYLTSDATAAKVAVAGQFVGAGSSQTFTVTVGAAAASAWFASDAFNNAITTNSLFAGLVKFIVPPGYTFSSVPGNRLFLGVKCVNIEAALAIF